MSKRGLRFSTFGDETSPKLLSPYLGEIVVVCVGLVSLDISLEVVVGTAL